ncbi:hypothetical protein K435DRAFT_580173, partial [Dendrothele bispora CBS 962.96]
KMAHLYLEDITRSEAIVAALEAHNEHENFNPGPNHGPPFKMYWTGLTRSHALTIEYDNDFSTAITALKNRRGRHTTVSIEFELDGMEPYKIRKRVTSADNDIDGSLELSIGTKVPRLNIYSEDDRLNGRFVLQLQTLWKCAEHPGEHGQAGWCYRDATGQHLGLNIRKLNIWAAAMAAGECTKRHPPNSIEFDGLWDGRLTSVKPRGRNGPHTGTSGPSEPPSDIHSLLMAATLNVLQNSVSGNQVTPPQHSNQVPEPKTPSRNRTGIPSSPVSPIPTSSGELHNFLRDLHNTKGIDFTSFESLFEANEYTPDILHLVPVSTLRELTHAPEGRVLKMVDFAKVWNGRLERKKKK